MIPADRLEWRTSSYSSNGEQCVEVAPWRTSSYSTNGGENCVEVSPATDRMLVRDTKCREAGIIAFTPDAWTSFLSVTTGRA